MEKKLTLGSDKKLMGVCSGFAEYLSLDVTLVRIVWVILSIFPGTIIGGVLVYLICWGIMPKRA